MFRRRQWEVSLIGTCSRCKRAEAMSVSVALGIKMPFPEMEEEALAA